MSLAGQEYIEFRDGLYRAEMVDEPHTHHAYYDDEGKLTRICAVCNLDLTDSVHLASAIKLAEGE